MHVQGKVRRVRQCYGTVGKTYIQAPAPVGTGDSHRNCRAGLRVSELIVRPFPGILVNGQEIVAGNEHQPSAELRKAGNPGISGNDSSLVVHDRRKPVFGKHVHSPVGAFVNVLDLRPDHGIRSIEESPGVQVLVHLVQAYSGQCYPCIPGLVAMISVHPDFPEVGSDVSRHGNKRFRTGIEPVYGIVVCSHPQIAAGILTQ